MNKQNLCISIIVLAQACWTDDFKSLKYLKSKFNSLLIVPFKLGMESDGSISLALKF